MRIRWISCSIVVAALAAAGCGKRDVVVTTTALPASATHGGDVVVLGDARFEVVHEPATGSVTLYQLRSDRTVVLVDAPSIEIRAASGVVPVTLSRVEDGVWRATSASLREASPGEIRIVARIDGRRFDESILASTAAETTPEVTPASVPPMPTPEPAPAPREEAPADAPVAKPESATRTLAIADLGTVHVTHDAKSGTLTLHVTDADGKKMEIEKAVLVLEGADRPRELVLESASDDTLSWTASDDALKASLSGRVVVTVDGKEHSTSLSAAPAARAEVEDAPPAKPADEPPAPPAPDEDVRKMNRIPDAALPAADEEPVNPPDPHPEPADKPGPANSPGGQTDSNASEARVALEGSVLLAVAGTDAQLEVLHDKNAGKLTIQPVRGHAALLLDEPPVLFLASKEPTGAGKATFNRLEGKPTWWLIHTELKDRDVLGKIRLTIGGKEHEVDLTGPRVVAAPSTYVVLGSSRLDVDHDGVAGMMAIRGGTQFQSLTFLARAADGRTVPIVLTPVQGQPGHFRATHEALRAERLDGRFTARIDGRDVEGVLQTGARADAATRPGAGAGSTPPAPGSGSGGAGSGAGTGR